MATVLSSTEQRVILRNVSWETYERLLDERGDEPVPRFSFDRGDLEIISPSSEHEEYKCAFAQIVDVVAEELGINIRRLGSTTFRRQPVQRGFEPDACFYIQSVAQVRGRRRIDLLVDPPPDLIIEVDISSDSLKKEGIFAALRVREVWCYDGNSVTIHELVGEEYVERNASVALPLLTSAALTELIEESKCLDSIPWLRKFRKWVRDHAA